MVRVAKIVVAMLCIVCVLALCVAPYVDIPFTVLKALQDIFLLMFAVFVCVLPLMGLFCRVRVRCGMLRSDHSALIRSLCSPLETTCVLQC